jgi:hypothetical protein
MDLLSSMSGDRNDRISRDARRDNGVARNGDYDAAS